ncbi:MAG: histidine triad nucleotide-binding protein [Planctomycetaceae bacterium]|nr:histidine triad nucleotide-binding protein [Planctomycetaceae bacterium]
MAENCIFCRIVRGEIPSTTVYDSEEFIAFTDINPAAPVHLLVVPKRHIARLSEAVAEDEGLLGRFMLAIGEVVRKNNIGDYRLIINDGPGAGQTVFHLHAHILSGRQLGEKLL